MRKVTKAEAAEAQQIMQWRSGQATILRAHGGWHMGVRPTALPKLPWMWTVSRNCQLGIWCVYGCEKTETAARAEAEKMARLLASRKKGTDMNQVEIMRSKGFIPATEVAKKAGVHISTVYHWLEKGWVQGEPVSTRRYVKLSSLVSYLGVEQSMLLGFIQGASGA